MIGLVFLGGGLGSLARFGVGSLSTKMYKTDFLVSKIKKLNKEIKNTNDLQSKINLLSDQNNNLMLLIIQNKK